MQAGRDRQRLVRQSRDTGLGLHVTVSVALDTTPEHGPPRRVGLSSGHTHARERKEDDMKKSNKITDESIFSGWHEFDGCRFESRGQGVYGIYRLRDGAYVHAGVVQISASARGQKRLIALDEALTRFDA